MALSAPQCHRQVSLQLIVSITSNFSENPFNFLNQTNLVNNALIQRLQTSYQSTLNLAAVKSEPKASSSESTGELHSPKSSVSVDPKARSANDSCRSVPSTDRLDKSVIISRKTLVDPCDSRIAARRSLQNRPA